MLGYLYRKRYGSKIAWANRTEGDRLGTGLSSENILKPSHSSYLPAYEDETVCSKMLAYKIQMLGNYPEESRKGIIFLGDKF